MSFNFSKKLADYIWINREFVKWEDANIHVLTHSLHYSGAVFEGQRSYNGKIFRLDDHTERLLKSADYMGLKHDYSALEINQACKDILIRNNLKDSYIRPLMWRGAGSLRIATDDDCQVNCLILAINSNPPFRHNLRLTLGKWRKLPPDSIPPQCKSSAHYAMSIVSINEAKAKGFDDALLLDIDGNVAECTGSNIFFSTGNKLVTPIADKFLNGITRQTIISLAKEIGIDVSEQIVTLDSLKNYDGCFITGSAAEIASIASITTQKEVFHFTNLSIVQNLQERFAKVVGKSID